VLGLGDVRPLAGRPGAGRKIVTFVPEDEVDTVRSAMASAGGGIIGNYDTCSYHSRGTGTFRGNARSSPVVGRKGILERVVEIRIEMPVEDDRIPAVVAALRQAHPYEEPAYDIYPVDGARSATGRGALGTLKHSMTASAFVRHVKEQLNARGLRHAGLPVGRIRTVAVCGGAGGDMLGAAMGAGADAFVTADVKYHSFLEATGRILLIDAGHFETEHPVVGHVGNFLRSSLSDNHPDVTVTSSAVRTSTVVFV
jgi:hypothetical protein